MKQVDLTRPCRVQVLDGHKRPWHRAFRKTPVYRTVFAGYINQMDFAQGGATRMELEDAMSRLNRTQVQL